MSKKSYLKKIVMQLSPWIRNILYFCENCKDYELRQTRSLKTTEGYSLLNNVTQSCALQVY